MAKKSYDWVAIKVQFINSSLSVQEFSDKYAIPYGSLKRQVTQGKWLDERSANNAEVIRKSSEISTDARALKLAQSDDDCVKTAEEINRKLRELLPTIDSPMALKALSGTLKDIQSVTRLALGASTDNQAVGSSSDFAKILEEIENEEQQGTRKTLISGI